MRIVLIIPGTGGTFYCENCLRDAALVKALRAHGHDVVMVPMYLPLVMDAPDAAAQGPIFFGGVNAYLQQQTRFFRTTPRWLDRIFDARWLLDLAARRAGSMRAHGLGAMTLSMLRGEDGNQAKELARLLGWLKDLGPVDIVHLSNALLLGLAKPLRAQLTARVVCSLQDEDSWLDALDKPYDQRCWQAARDAAAQVHAFVAVSRFYAGRMRERLALPPERLHVVHPGIDLDGYAPAPQPPDPPVIGYLGRMSPSLGLATLAEAFIRLRQPPFSRKLRLRISGGMTADDRPFVSRLRGQLRQAGLAGDVDVVEGFDRSTRLCFLRSLTVLSVPQAKPEALGLFILEALASGVPVVQPAIGGFPELIEATGGGVLFDPNTPEALATALDALLLDPDRLRALAQRGRASVLERFGLAQAAQRMLEVYEHL